MGPTLLHGLHHLWALNTMVVSLGLGIGRLLSSTSYNPPLHNFYRFFQDLTGCKLVAIYLDRPISYFFFQVPANFFFIVMTTTKNLGIDK